MDDASAVESLVTLLGIVKLKREFAIIVVKLVMSKLIVVNQRNKAMMIVTNVVSLVTSLVIASMKKMTEGWPMFHVIGVETRVIWQRTVRAALKHVTTARNPATKPEIALKS